jgi:hypothetical protein
VAKWVEDGPNLKTDGVVRGRRADLGDRRPPNAMFTGMSAASASSMSGANVAVRPNKVMPNHCCDFGTRVRTMMMTVGMTPLLVEPWPARNTISCVSDVETAQAIEKPTKSPELTER